MAVAFDEPAPPASPQAIEQVERSLDIVLPEDYRRFLRQQNGGYLEPNAHEQGRGVRVRYLYSADPTGDEHLDDLESVAWLYSPEGEADDELDPGFLPIGEDDGGNLICLKVSGDDYGAVYFWEHEVLPESDAYTRIADSFEAFFAGLRPAGEPGAG
ncbi:MAG: SMI1/KNR4 family protein [Actinomycetota bacterium]|nr:SMI1/KNR4 family protein [Actinomycetota bacterium]